MKNIFSPLIKLTQFPLRFPLKRNYRFLVNKDHYLFNTLKSTNEEQIKQIKSQISKFQAEKTQTQELKEKIELSYKIITAKQQFNQIQNQQDGFYEGYSIDLLEICNQHYQANENEQCKKVLDQIFSNNTFELEFQAGSLINKLIASQIHQFAANYYKEREFNLDKATFHGQEAYKMNKKLVEEQCPFLNSAIKNIPVVMTPEMVPFEMEIEIISNTAHHLSELAQIHKLAGKIGESISCLNEKVELLAQASQLYEKILLNELKPTIISDEKLNVNNQLINTIVSQAMTFTKLSSQFLDLHLNKECFSSIQTAFQFFDFLLKNKIIEQTEEQYIRTQQIFVESLYKFKPEDEDFPKQLKTLQEILEKSQQKLNKEIYEELTFDYHLLLQNMTGNKLSHLKNIIENLKKINHPKLFEKEILYNQAIYSSFIRLNQFDEAWIQAELLLDLLRNNVRADPFIYIEVLFDICDFARDQKKFTSAFKLNNEIEKIINSPNFNFQRYSVNLYLLKGKIIVEEQLSDQKDLQKIEEGMVLFEKAFELLKQTGNHGFEFALSVLELKATYYSKINDKEKSAEQLQRIKTLLENSQLPNKEEILSKMEENFKKI